MIYRNRRGSSTKLNGSRTVFFPFLLWMCVVLTNSMNADNCNNYLEVFIRFPHSKKKTKKQNIQIRRTETQRGTNNDFGRVL